jgi:hypothetical protein
MVLLLVPRCKNWCKKIAGSIDVRNGYSSGPWMYFNCENTSGWIKKSSKKYHY